MITFKSFLAESRSAPLYHKTTLSGFYYILRSGKIEPRTNHHGHSKNGVSLTRSIKSAFGWQGFEPGIVIEIDQQKLIQNKRVKPINAINVWYPKNPRYHAKSEELFEEFVEGPIESKYFTRFIVENQTLRSFDYTTEKDFFNKIMNIKSEPSVYVWKDKKTIPFSKLELD